MRRALAAALAAGLALAARRAPAAHADEGCAARVAWIDARLEHDAHRARVWSWTWGVLFGAATVGSLVAVPLVDHEERPDWVASAATSAAGLVPLLFLPLEVMHDADELHAERAAGAESCALLPSAEARLRRDAASEADGRAWWNHALNLAVNGGAGLVLGLAYDRWQSGLLTAVVGTAVGEVMIFTQPTDALDDAAAYRAAGAGGPPLTLGLAPAPGGLSLVVRGAF